MSCVMNEELVNLHMKAKTKEDAIKELAKNLEMAKRIDNYDEYIESVFERENMTSTGIGFKIAIPHGKCSAVKTSTIVFGRLEEEIEWESLDGDNVRFVFLLAIPESCCGDEHLHIIAQLSRQLIHEEFRQKLATAKEPQDVVALLDGQI